MAVAAWIILMALTTLSWKLAREGHAGWGAEASAIALLVLAFSKVLIVGHVFMDLRRAARILQIAFVCWCAAICATLVILYGL
ncbi:MULTISPECIES: cytochrome C oxidase subunit IV family protein [Streptomyces]|uniref:cytochrome C oxidase subunit IV family protein n=1 Tax=Streptomyces TaxID=1883 RepID=UPI0004CCEE42|nr:MULTISPECIES: cytochrome C oxidase subunit IV family protein [Streptomyces]